MHELSYVTGFINIAVKELKKNPSVIPVKLVVEVGEMTGVLPEYLYKYFPAAAKDTPLADAALEVISVPVEVICSTCRTTYHPDQSNGYSCPSCGGKGVKLLHGRECMVKQLEVKEQPSVT